MSDSISFSEFYEGFGFSAYPFNSFTAENEKEQQPDLFTLTKLYSPLSEAFKAGQTMILSGDRGTGKTSITYDFVRRAESDQLICQIDDFSSLEKDFSDVDFYKFILSSMVNNFFSNVTNFRHANKKLTDDEKILLTYYYIHFASDSTRGLAQRTARKIQISLVKRLGIKLYNFFRNPFNIAVNVGVTILSDIVARSAGSTTVTAKVSEYFPEISAGIESKFPKSDDTLEAVRRFADLAFKIGYKKIVIILDKIDEDARLENAAEEIADFVEPILTNNKFLLDEHCQVVVSIWVVPLNFLKDKVRTQKIYSPEIRWEHDDLKRVYERRVKVFSNSLAADFDNTFLKMFHLK
ncbi:P-loop ATPase, Sll1717 family [Xanthobacter sediminis]